MDISKISHADRSEVLVQALPYIQTYNGKTVVIKYGGNAMVNEELQDAVMTDIVLLRSVGVHVVLVHGGGPEISEMLKKIGKESRFVGGLRYTEGGYIPVVSSVADGENGAVYNINADTAAAQIAACLHAEKLLLMTDIPGLLRDKDDPSTLIPEVKVSEIPALKAQGIISGGMIPKIDCCVEAVRRGVKHTNIIDGRVPHAILMELFSDAGFGTMFSA